MEKFNFKILKNDKKTAARVGVISTRRGEIETPYFVPVATLGSVRSLDSRDLENLGARCALVNTYHLHLKPGDKNVKKMGGMHKFMRCEKPLFSDSGGFQAFSLGLAREHEVGKIGFFPKESKSAKDGPLRDLSHKGLDPFSKNLTKITDKGVEFRSIYDGSRHFFDAKASMKIQANLDTDIIMAFDECTSPLSDKDYTALAMKRTHEWAKQSLKYHNKIQALYGIIQGGWFRDLRDESTNFINSLPFDGIAIGGSLGNCKQDMHEILDWVILQLDSRPRHLLGIGEIDDIFECVQRGIDTFDCVTPTRNARRGSLFISPKSGGSIKNKFRINIKSGRFALDKSPVDPACGCATCQDYSRAYLHHLFSASELSYYRLATIHNLNFMFSLMDQIRENIKKGTFLQLKKRWLGF
jgi:queuine tRNA-ribosyltransferase